MPCTAIGVPVTNNQSAYAVIYTRNCKKVPWLPWPTHPPILSDQVTASILGVTKHFHVFTIYNDDPSLECRCCTADNDALGPVYCIDKYCTRQAVHQIAQCVYRVLLSRQVSIDVLCCRLHQLVVLEVAVTM